jgi:AsmA family protein
MDSHSTPSPVVETPGRRHRRRVIGLEILGVVLVLIALLIYFWNWDWFIPLVETDASSTLGRQVTLQHLHVRLGRTTLIAADKIAIANPKGFDGDLATIDQLVIEVEVMGYIHNRVLTLSKIVVEHPVANVRQLPDGTDNYTLQMKSSGSNKPTQIGNLYIHNGAASVVMAKYKTDMNLTIHTERAPTTGTFANDPNIVVVTAGGTYSEQPISGSFRGGALLSLRDPAHPYPVDLHIANGSTTVALIGTVEQPMSFGGAKLKLTLAGQDMSDLYQLTNIPLPATPPYSITGHLDYTRNTIRFDNFYGRVGSSDLEGDLDETHPISGGKPLVTANLASNRVDLTDLGGFLGATPGKTTTPGQTAATREKVARAVASPKLLPSTPINLPKINMANFEVHYTGKHIINKNVPLDNVVVNLSIENGRISLHPLDFAVGTGTIASDIDLNPMHNVLHTRADIDFRKLQLARLMVSTHTFAGDGTVGGSAHLRATGNSVAEMLGHGDGTMQLFMSHGGDISALMVDLAGLQVGDGILSLLGIPHKANIQCLVSDFTLTDGQLDTKALLLATTEANILGSGSADLSTEKLNLRLSTQATHFSIGSLSTPINIHGTLKDPSVLPAPGPLAARALPAIGLGVLFPPLALIPTIRLGLGDKNACEDTLQSLHAGNPHNPS